MRALLSVWDKTGMVEFARGLHELGVELVSSGGTAKAIDEAGIPVTYLADVTGFPEMLDHRVVTLHPKVHGGILADRGKQSHLDDMEQYGIEPFDIVVTNLYPFRESPDIETIDIGGPAMTRAAAKNHAWVAIVTSPDQYDAVLAELRADGEISAATRRAFALEAFAQHRGLRRRDRRVAARRARSSRGTSCSRSIAPTSSCATARTRTRRARATAPSAPRAGGTASPSTAASRSATSTSTTPTPRGASRTTSATQPTVAIIKHANPCGVAVAADLATAYQLALECDERSAFGGIVALNRPVDAATVERMVAGPQADLVIAPGYDDGTIEALRKKRKNTRLLEAPPPEPTGLDFRQISGGFLVQSPHHFAAGRDDWRVVTKRAPTESEWRDAELAWRIVGHVKSNAIVLVKDGQAVGIGAGQQNRVESGEIAAKKAAGRAGGGAAASDAFYPFPDGIDAAADAGVAVVLQPGGSVGDEKVIERADERGVAMVFTGERHFLH